MTNTIKLQTSYMDDEFYRDYSEVKFTDDKRILILEDLINDSRVNNMGLNSIDMEYLFAEYLKGQEEKYATILITETGLDYYYEPEEIEDYSDPESFLELLQDNRDNLEDLLYHISDQENKKEDTVINELLNQVGYKFYTAGYSPWSYYIAPSDLTQNYIEDLYQGYNFYTVEFIEDGESYEIIDHIYATSLEELDQEIKAIWSLRDYELDQEDLEEYEELV